MENLDVAGFKGAKKRKFDAQFKLKVVDAAKKPGSISSASEHYGIDRKNIREWSKNEPELRKLV